MKNFVEQNQQIYTKSPETKENHNQCVIWNGIGYNSKIRKYLA